MHYLAFYSGKDLGKHINRQKQVITMDGDVAYIQLYDKYGNEKELAIIDSEDVSRVEKHKWFSSRKYVVTRLTPTNKFYRLHRFILDCAETGHPSIDHINHNPLDNRKSNLRSVDNSQSTLNRRVNFNKKYKGVTFADSQTGNLAKKWRVKVRVPYTKRNVEFGRFETEEEAAYVYDQWALQVHGEYAKTNFEY